MFVKRIEMAFPVAVLCCVLLITRNIAESSDITTKPQLKVGNVPFCYFFNSTLCNIARKGNKKADQERDCNIQPMVCKTSVPLGEQYCLSVWNNEEGGTLMHATCLPVESNNDHDYCNNPECVHVVAEKSVKLGRCCCNKPFCNGNWSVTVVPHTDSTDLQSTEDNSGPILHIAIPLSIAIAILLTIIFGILWYYNRKNKTNKNIPSGNKEAALLEDDNLDEAELQPVAVQSQGRFGKVYIGGEVDGVRVAIKSFTPSNRQWWLQERDIYRLPGMKHDNLTRFVGACHRGEGSHSEFLIIMEYHPYGSIYDYLKGHVLTWNEMLTISTSFVRGLSYLHDEWIIGGVVQKYSIAHRDIKSKNILLKHNKTAAIADFGLAQKFETGQMSDMHIQAGTHRYMSPEVLEGAITFSKDSFLRIDVYAAALVLWELLTRSEVSENRSSMYKLPFEEEIGGLVANLDLMQDLVATNKIRPKFPDCLKKHEVTKTLMDTIDESWDQDAEARLSASCLESRLHSLHKFGSPTTAELGLNCSVRNQLNQVQHNQQETQNLLITDNLSDPIIR